MMTEEQFDELERHFGAKSPEEIPDITNFQIFCETFGLATLVIAAFIIF